MTRRLLLALAPFVIVTPVCDAARPTGYYYLTARKTKPGDLQYAAFKGGKLVLGPAASHRESHGAAADRWHVMGTQIKSSVGGGYLAYDPSGKSPRVFLSPRPVKGAEWRVRRVYNKLHNHLGESVGDRWGVVQAASGPLKGWSLDVEEVKERRADGKSVTVRRLVLRKKPSWNVEAGQIYDH